MRRPVPKIEEMTVRGSLVKFAKATVIVLLALILTAVVIIYTDVRPAFIEF
jgi:hypothetical protein